MPRAVWQPTSAPTSTRTVASRVARLTKLTAASKGNEAALLVRSLVRFFFVFFSTLNRRVSRTRRAAVPPGSPNPPNLRVPPSRARDYGLPFAQPKESQEVTTASLMVRRAGLGVFNRAYLWTPAGLSPRPIPSPRGRCQSRK